MRARTPVTRPGTAPGRMRLLNPFVAALARAGWQSVTLKPRTPSVAMRRDGWTLLLSWGGYSPMAFLARPHAKRGQWADLTHLKPRGMAYGMSVAAVLTWAGEVSGGADGR